MILLSYLKANWVVSSHFLLQKRKHKLLTSFSYCRSALLEIGTVCTVHANSAGWLGRKPIREMIFMMQMTLNY